MSQSPGSITWYAGKKMIMPPLPEVDAILLSKTDTMVDHIKLRPVTWEACKAYFKEMKRMYPEDYVRKISEDMKCWVCVMPLTDVHSGGARAVLVGVSTTQGVRLPAPTEIHPGTSSPGLSWSWFASPVDLALTHRNVHSSLTDHRCAFFHHNQGTFPSSQP
jgi:hypothetical protein